MQFLPLSPMSYDTANYDTNYTDYSSQDSSMSNFSNELDTALSSGKQDVSSSEYDEESDNDRESSSVYSARAEIYSFFVPQDPRFNQEELTKLAKAFQQDNISIDAQNALADLMNKPEGPTLKELLSALSQSMRGGNAKLNDTEIAYLQNLAGRANPTQPDLLYDNIRFSDGLTGMQALMASLKQNPTTLSSQELSALSKVFNLPQDVEQGMQQMLSAVRAVNGNKPLSAQQVDAVFKDAKAVLQSRSDEFAVMKNSLEQNLKPLLESAQKREAEERRALMRENRDVLYSKTLIEDSVITRVMGEDLNRTTHKDDMKNMQDKGVVSHKEMENKEIYGKAQNQNTRLTEQPEENILSQNLTAKVQYEREANAKSEEKFFADTLDEQENADNALNKLTNDKLAQNNLSEKEQDANSQRDFSEQRSNSEMSHNERVLASMTAAQSMQADFQQIQTANFAEQAENVRAQVQDSVLTMMRNGARRLEVSLNPLELGQMAVVLTMKNGEVNAVIQAEKAESASLINQQVEVIRQELEHQGFKVQNIEVEVGLSDSNFAENNGNYSWESMQQHNSEQSFRENLQNLNYLRALTRKNNSSSDMNDTALAHNMQNTGNIVAGKEINSLQGLHIVT